MQNHELVHDHSDAANEPTRHRVGIWLVGGYFILSATGGVVVLFLTAAKVLDLPSQKVALLNSLPPMVVFFSFLSLVLNLLGGAFLVLRRKVALTTLAGGAVSTVVGHLLAPRFGAQVDAPALLLTATILSVLCLLTALAYVYWLVGKGLLHD